MSPSRRLWGQMRSAQNTRTNCSQPSRYTGMLGDSRKQMYLQDTSIKTKSNQPSSCQVSETRDSLLSSARLYYCHAVPTPPTQQSWDRGPVSTLNSMQPRHLSRKKEVSNQDPRQTVTALQRALLADHAPRKKKGDAGAGGAPRHLP